MNPTVDKRYLALIPVTLTVGVLPLAALLVYLARLQGWEVESLLLLWALIALLLASIAPMLLIAARPVLMARHPGLENPRLMRISLLLFYFSFSTLMGLWLFVDMGFSRSGAVFFLAAVTVALPLLGRVNLALGWRFLYRQWSQDQDMPRELRRIWTLYYDGRRYDEDLRWLLSVALNPGAIKGNGPVEPAHQADAHEVEST